MVDEVLGVHTEPSWMKVLHRWADGRDPGGDQGRRPIEVARHLPKRGEPMPLLSQRKVFGLLDRHHGVGEGGFADQHSRHRGVIHHVHWDHHKFPVSGLGEMYLDDSSI